MTAREEATEPRLDLAAVRAFFDQRAAGWDENCRHDATRIGQILDLAQIGRGQQVLDVACGTGVLFPYYLQRGVASILGVDLSPQMIACAAAKYQDPRIRLLAADVEQVQLEDYDRIVVYSALPHFSDPVRLLRRLAAALRPEGRLTVAHSESRAVIDSRHRGAASSISRSLPPAAELAAALTPFLQVDQQLDTDALYLVSGTLR